MKNKTAIIIVNGITMIRVVGTIVLPFICHYLSPGALVIYLVSLLLTDSLDGILARRLKACTIFGTLLDQGADKLLGIATLAVLSQEYLIMALPILTETIIVLITMRGALRGGIGQSSILGKIKTVVLGLALVAAFCTVFASDIIVIFDQGTNLGGHFINVFNYIIINKIMIMNSVAFISVGAGAMVACDYGLRARAEVKQAKESGLKPEDYNLKKGQDLIEALFSEEYYQKTKNQPLIKRIGVKQN